MNRNSQQQGPQAKGTIRDKRKVLPIQPVRERIFYSWMSGTKITSLAASYGQSRDVIEEVNRERVRELWRERKAA